MTSSRTASREPDSHQFESLDSTVGFDDLKISTLKTTDRKGGVVGDIVGDEEDSSGSDVAPPRH
jgi:hypothetical protein